MRKTNDGRMLKPRTPSTKRMSRAQRREYWKSKADTAVSRLYETRGNSHPSCSRAQLAERNAKHQGKPDKKDAKNTKARRAGKPDAKEPDAASSSGSLPCQLHKGKKDTVPISKKPEPEFPQACYCHCFLARNQLALARSSA